MANTNKTLFITPERISRDFPTIKLQITDINEHTYDIEALLDSGASSTYISRSFVEDHHIPTRKLNYTVFAYNADDSPNQTTITHEAHFISHIRGHQSRE